MKNTTKQLHFTLRKRALRIWIMEVHLPPDKEARLRQFASRTGKNAEQAIVEAVDRMLEYDERFIAAVEKGRACARKGDLLEHDEVVERIERTFNS